VISAAGLGSRLGIDMPKCMIEICGKRLIEHQLDLLKGIPDVRIVVGFKEKEVIQFVRDIREDVLFVRNPRYASTSNSFSINLATRELKEPFMIMDGDLIVDPVSLNEFLRSCRTGEDLIGVSKAKTEDAVFVHTDGNMIKEFSFEKKAGLEWCGIAFFSNIRIPSDGGYVFKEIEKKLPVRYKEINCYEIDTPEDLAQAVKYAEQILG